LPNLTKAAKTTALKTAKSMPNIVERVAVPISKKAAKAAAKSAKKLAKKEAKLGVGLTWQEAAKQGFLNRPQYSYFAMDTVTKIPWRQLGKYGKAALKQSLKALPIVAAGAGVGAGVAEALRPKVTPPLIADPLMHKDSPYADAYKPNVQSIDDAPSLKKLRVTLNDPVSQPSTSYKKELFESIKKT